MFAKSFLCLAGCLLLLACSDDGSSASPASAAGSAGSGNAGSGNAGNSSAGNGSGAAGNAGNAATGGGAAMTGGAPGEDALIVPAGVAVNPTPGGNGVFEVTALTLRQGASGVELYAAVKNVGETKGCSPAFSVEVLDHDEQTLGVAVSGLLVQSFYRLSDGSGTIAACVAPGEVSMVAVNGLPSDLVVDEVARIDYRLNYWNLDAEPISGVTITDVQRVTRDEGVAYTGTFTNDFDVPMTSPSIAIFPVNHVGRPLGVAAGNSTAELAPGSSWSFETDTIAASGTEQVAYPASGP